LIAPAIAMGASLSGTVTDKTDGLPLLGATVTVRPLNPSSQVLGIATEENGDYEITNIPPGDYHVIISFVGYSTETFELEVGPGIDQARQDAALTPRAVDLHTISVTASRRPEKLNDAPASVSTVGSDAVAERTTLTPTDHVSGLPAVDVARTGLNQTNMVTRGFNNIFSGALLVLVDNRLARVPSLRAELGGGRYAHHNQVAVRFGRHDRQHRRGRARARPGIIPPCRQHQQSGGL
jgi:iron complex outermembrane receptor protein